MIALKSVSSPVEPEKDGLRILVARFRGRGVDKGRYDLWMASLGPSEELLERLQSGDLGWSEFTRRYREEIFTDGDVDERNSTVKNRGQKFTLRLLRELGERQNVTLLCHCGEAEQHCHRPLLQKLIEGSSA